jgi:RNA polymerase sigma-70 factor, ECF subfamily
MVAMVHQANVSAVLSGGALLNALTPVLGLPSALTTERIKELGTHRGALLRFAKRKIRDEALAEDAVQDTLMAAFTSVERFQGQSQLKTWLVGILNHKIQDVFRRETRYVPFDEQDDDGETFSRIDQEQATEHYADNDPANQIDSARMNAVLEKHINDLPKSLRQVFRMQVLEGLSTESVCAALNITEANCWVRLHRARKQLATSMHAYR